MKLHLITVLLAAVFLTACRPQASKSEVVPIDTPSVVRPVPADTLPKPDTARIYTYKELEEINDELLRRWEATRHTPAGRNCAGFGIGASTIHIRLMVNTPEWQSRFRREVMDSPVFTFEGDAVLPELAATAPPSSGDVYLLPEREAWPDTVRQVRFLLCNASENRVTYGLGSDVAFRDAGGTWRRMPTNYAIADILCMLDTDAVTTFSQTLYPDICPLGPGTHRYFHEVYIDGKRTTLMATFRLTDAASTPAATELTPIPEAVLQGRGEDEWRRQVQAQQDADRTGEVHVMPAFPGGDEALAAWLRAHPVTHDGPPGSVTVRMTVRTDGSLGDVFIARPLHTVADSLARRVVEQMPRWHAALRDGLPVRWQVSVVVPVGSTSQADTFKR